MIGDSIMASTSRRYGGEMCEELVPRGWEVEIDAETGRFVDFGDRVLDARLDAEWDVAVVMLGNNYGADQGVFEEYLTEIVDRLAPRPTVLLTVTEFRPDRAEVNEVIYDIAAENENVRGRRLGEPRPPTTPPSSVATGSTSATSGGPATPTSSAGSSEGARLRRGRLPRLGLHRRLRHHPPARAGDHAPEHLAEQSGRRGRWRRHDERRRRSPRRRPPLHPPCPRLSLLRK